MFFWASLALTTGAVAVVLALAFRRGTAAGGGEMAVYRDQLAEVERDRERGVLTPDEAGRVRAEVARRLLEADRAAVAATAAGGGPGFWAATVTGIAVAALAFGLYLDLGTPGEGDLPLAQRLADAERQMQARASQEEAEAQWGQEWTQPEGLDAEYVALIGQLRSAVAERPDDAEGWTLLARHEAALGNYRAAWRAAAHLLALKGEAAGAADYANLAELMIVAAGGFVSPEAEAALSQALARDRGEPRARYYTGLLFVQNQRPDLTFHLWKGLLDEGPPDAPWIAAIRADIEAVAMLAGVRYALPDAAGAPGPSAADVAAAAEMTAEERQEMIRGMVEGLAGRLAAEGGPAEDWARLIGALGVLGESERARAILAEAEGIFAADAAGLATVRAAARQAGIE